jgi:hypothetical protein
MQRCEFTLPGCAMAADRRAYQKLSLELRDEALERWQEEKLSLPNSGGPGQFLEGQRKTGAAEDEVLYLDA